MALQAAQLKQLVSTIPLPHVFFCVLPVNKRHTCHGPIACTFLKLLKHLNVNQQESVPRVHSAVQAAGLQRI